MLWVQVKVTWEPPTLSCLRPNIHVHWMLKEPEEEPPAQNRCLNFRSKDPTASRASLTECVAGASNPTGQRGAHHTFLPQAASLPHHAPDISDTHHPVRRPPRNHTCHSTHQISQEPLLMLPPQHHIRLLFRS